MSTGKVALGILTALAIGISMRIIFGPGKTLVSRKNVMNKANDDGSLLGDAENIGNRITGQVAGGSGFTGNPMKGEESNEINTIRF